MGRFMESGSFREPADWRLTLHSLDSGLAQARQTLGRSASQFVQ
jgi:hypothetical protein